MFVLGDLIEVRCVIRKGTEGAVNVRHYDVSGITGTGADDVVIADAFFTHWATAYTALLTSYAMFHEVTVRRVLPLPVTALAVSTALPTVGLVAGDPLPNVVTGIITLRTGLPGRAGRGRIYVAFPAEADNDSTSRPSTAPTGGYAGRLNTLRDQMLDDVVAGVVGNVTTLTPVIFHKALGTWTEVSSASSRDYWATQRRRNNGRF